MTRYAVPQLSPQDAQRFTVQRSNARRSLLTGQAENQFNRTQAGLTYQDQLRDMTSSWDRRRSQLPGQYVQRGILNSGIYHQGLQDYATDRQSDFRSLQRGYQQQLGGLNIAGRRLHDEYTNTVASSRAAELARRAEIASRIRSVL